MGLGNGKDAGDTVRAELVERLSNNGGPDRMGRLGQRGPHVGEVVKKIAVAVVKF